MSATAAQPRPRAIGLHMWITWTGLLISVIPVFILLSSARWKLTHNPWYVAEWGRIGYAPGAINREPRLRALLPLRLKTS